MTHELCLPFPRSAQTWAALQSDHTLSYKYLGWPRYDFRVTVIINSIVIFIIIRNVAVFVTLCFPSTLVDVITVFIVIVKYFTKSCLQKVLASYFSCFHSFLLVWSMRLVIISIFSFFNFFFDGSECMRVFFGICQVQSQSHPGISTLLSKYM